MRSLRPTFSVCVPPSARQILPAHIGLIMVAVTMTSFYRGLKIDEVSGKFKILVGRKDCGPETEDSHAANEPITMPVTFRSKGKSMSNDCSNPVAHRMCRIESAWFESSI